METEFIKGTSTNIKHAFFTRHGGVSEGVYAELNVAKHVPDDPKKVDINRLRALEALHTEANRFVFLGKLEHSNRIEEVGLRAGGVEISNHDVLITNTPDLTIGLSVADCMPIIVVDEEAPALALIHAGWRGLKVEVIRHTIDALEKEYSVSRDRLKAIIGPSIGPLSYEVGSDLVKQFERRYSTPRGDKYLFDMWTLAEDQLNACGVKVVENLKIDTFVDERFYSHRRDGGHTGRFLAAASL